jgi:hypothetical protein
MSRLRTLIFGLLVAAIAAGCTADGKLNLPRSGAAFSPYIAGLSPNEFEDRYLPWWRGMDPLYEPSAMTNILPMDARCPLRFDYTRYTGDPGQDARPEIRDGATDGIYLTDVIGNRGFYHRTGRLEALLVVYGTARKTTTDTTYTCAGPTSTSNRVYLPIRIDMRSGAYIIEGWTQPAATIELAAELASQSSRVKKDSGGQWEDADSTQIYSPLRLTRFQITEGNIQRVLNYARIKEASSGGAATARRIHWFRVSDLAPYYRSKAPSADPGCAAAYAFVVDYESYKGLCTLDAQLPISAPSAEAIYSDLYVDRMGRMGDPNTSAESIATDDGCVSNANSGSCTILQGGAGSTSLENDWEIVEQQLAIINATASSKGGIGAACDDATDNRPSSCTGDDLKRAQAFATIRELFTKRGASSALVDGISALPEGFGSIDRANSDVIGVIAGHGQTAWDDTVAALRNGPATKRFGSFVGETSELGNIDKDDTATVTPSFVLSDVGATTEAQEAWLREHSALFGGSAQSVSLMRFKTEVAGSGQSAGVLSYHQGPLGRIAISVSGGTLRNEGVTYTTDFLPLHAIGRTSAEGVSARESYWAIDPRNILQAINDFIVGIYQGTFGAALTELSSFAVDGILATPGLNRFELDLAYSTPDRPIYQTNDNVDTKLLEETEYANIPASIAALTGSKAACTYAQYTGLLNAPGNDDGKSPSSFVYPENADPKVDPTALHSVEECYVNNTVFGLFQLSRGLTLILFLVLIARFFIRLGTGKERDMTIMGFFARSMIALAVILGPEIILQLGAAIISEAITLTNFFGTQLSGGRPYSYLWLFGAYLSRADVTAVNVFSLMLLAPFSILGLAILSIVTFLRSAFTIALIAISPFWMIDLLYRTESRFFNRSLLLMMRLYLIPILTLITLMFLFLFFPASTDLSDSQTNFGFFAAVIGLLAILLVVFVPIWASNKLVGAFGDQVLGRISKALKSSNDSKKADFLEAGMRGEEGLKQFRSDLVAREAARDRELADARSGGRLASGARGETKALKGGGEGGGALGDGGKKTAGALLAGAAAIAGGGKAAGLIGAARAAIGAEAGRPRTIGERMKALQAGGLKGAAVKGLGTGAKLTAWTARTASEMMVGSEVADTKAYADTKLDAARSSLYARLAAAGVTSTTGEIRTDTAQGRLAAAGLEIAGQARSEVTGYAAARLAVARGTFMSGVDAERRYLAASASIESTRVEVAELDAALSAGSLREDEARAAQSRVTTLREQIATNERVQIESAATIAAARSSSTAAIGGAVMRLRESAVATELFGATPEAAARSSVEAQAAAADAVLRRLDVDLDQLRLEERAATAAGDGAGQRAAQRAIAERTAFRGAVIAEREVLFDDAARRAIGADADATIRAAEVAADAFAAMGRASGSRARLRNTAAEAELATLDEQIGSIDAREASYREMRDRGVILTDAPDFEAERRTLVARRATLVDETARTGALVTDATTARTVLERWSRAAAGILPDGRPAVAGASIATAGAVAGAFAAGALAGAAGIVAGSATLDAGRNAGSSIGAALDARVADLVGPAPTSSAAPLPSPVDAPRPAVVRPAGPPPAPLSRPAGTAGTTMPLRPTSTAPMVTGIRTGAPVRGTFTAPAAVDVPLPPAAAGAAPDPTPVIVPAAPIVEMAPEPSPLVEETRSATPAVDWADLLATGSVEAIASAVAAGIAAGDATAATVGSDGVDLLRMAAGTELEGEIRATLGATLG